MPDQTSYYEAAIAEGIQRYPNYETDKSDRYHLRGFLAGMGVPQSYENYPSRAKYSKIGHTHTQQFNDGMTEGMAYSSQYTTEQTQKAIDEQQRKTEELINQMTAPENQFDFQSWWAEQQEQQ